MSKETRLLKFEQNVAYNLKVTEEFLNEIATNRSKVIIKCYDFLYTSNNFRHNA